MSIIYYLYVIFFKIDFNVSIYCLPFTKYQENMKVKKIGIADFKKLSLINSDIVKCIIDDAELDSNKATDVFRHMASKTASGDIKQVINVNKIKNMRTNIPSKRMNFVDKNGTNMSMNRVGIKELLDATIHLVKLNKSSFKIEIKINKNETVIFSI